MSKLDIFSSAIKYTLEPSLQEILQLCAKGKYPSQFKVVKGRIATAKGNVFEISRDPMEVCNLVHDIINDHEKIPKIVRHDLITDNNTRSSRPSRSAGSKVGVSDDAIYSFANRETRRLQMDEYHKDKLLSCIFTAIMLGDISSIDFLLQGEKIISINKIDTTRPCVELVK